MLHIYVTLLTNDDFFKYLKVDGKRVKSHLVLMNVIGGSKKKKKKDDYKLDVYVSSCTLKHFLFVVTESVTLKSLGNE